jgi:NDP-sugar pyrophosphorylase family protein
MAGRSSRFFEAGYKIPKYLIEVKGRTLLEYSLSSLPLSIADNIIFIALNEHIKNYSLNTYLKKIIPFKFQIVGLERVTRGQAETVLAAEQFVAMDKDLIIYNIDTFFCSANLEKTLLSGSKKDGILGAFIDERPIWSFAEIDVKTNIVKKTAEKEVISKFALTGFYHFSKAIFFFKEAREAIKADNSVLNEFYVAPLYNDLIRQGLEFTLDFVDEFIPLGTPEDVAKIV